MTYRTLGIIKPNALQKKWMGKIIMMIEENGFEIVEANLETLTVDEAQGFYREHKEKPFFEGLVEFMTCGPVFLMLLEKPNAVEDFRRLMGATDPAKAAPGTIRKLYGESIEANSVHGSDSPASAEREIAYFFGTSA